MTSLAGWQHQSNESQDWDADRDLHQAWCEATMKLVYDFAEAYCNHQCDDQQDRLHELNTARRALREHLMNQPDSMSLTDPELRAGIELLREAVAAEREACAKVCERLPAQQDIDVRDQCAAAIRARGEK